MLIDLELMFSLNSVNSMKLGKANNFFTVVHIMG